jgi:type VI secretion system secreted protein VgrG
MKYRAFSMLVLVFVFSLLAVNARADAFTNLVSDNFAVLAYAAVTNTGPTTISGNVGVSPGSSITGSGSITLSAPGTTFDTTNAAAAAGIADATGAYGILSGLTGLNLSGTNLGGLTLTPGVYNFSSSAQLTGTLTLDFTGPNQTIVITTVSTLTTASGSKVVLVGWVPTDSVYWAVGSNATLGTGSTFEGNIISNGASSDAIQTSATIGCGSVIALSGGTVTLDSNTIGTGCNSATTTTTGGVTTVTGLGTPTAVSTPEPGTLALLSLGLLGMVFLTFRKSRRVSLLRAC